MSQKASSYQYRLIEGRKTEDFRLRSRDTVFVPVIGAVAGIVGNVRRQGI